MQHVHAAVEKYIHFFFFKCDGNSEVALPLVPQVGVRQVLAQSQDYRQDDHGDPQ